MSIFSSTLLHKKKLVCFWLILDLFSHFVVIFSCSFVGFRDGSLFGSHSDFAGCDTIWTESTWSAIRCLFNVVQFCSLNGTAIQNNDHFAFTRLTGSLNPP